MTGSPLTVRVPSSFYDGKTRWPIRLANESPYQATITLGAQTLPLAPFTADVITPAQQVTLIAATFVQLATPLPASPVSQLLVSLAEPGESIEGTYPMALPRQSAAFGAWTQQGTVSAASGVESRQSFTVPAGTQSVAYVTTITSGSLVRPAILSIEDANGSLFASQNPVDDLNYGFAPVVGTTVVVDLDNTHGPGDTAFQTILFATPLPIVVALATAATTPFVNVFQVGSKNIQLGQTGQASSLPVAPATDYNPTLWQAPQKTVFATRTTAGTTTLLAGVANQKIRVFGWQIDCDEGAGAGSGASLITLEDDASALPVGFFFTNPGGGGITGFEAGLPLPVGAGLRLNVAVIGTNMAARVRAGVSQG